MARRGGKPGGLTVADRALHLAAFSAQRLSAWGLGAKLAALTALKCANLAVGAAVYKITTGDPWWARGCARLYIVMGAPRSWRRPGRDSVRSVCARAFV